MDELPKKIGKYPVLGIAGRGNMGVVYTGYDPFSDRDVAIKVCSLEGDQESTNRVARKLFFNEARMAGLLDHPNILRVLDAGENNRQPYIVMEYVEGGATLRPHCALPKLLPVPRVAEIVNKCANALDYAHRRGVIHRDIKPTNIMLTPDGDVRIADFGIAHRPLDDTTHVTGLLGSPRYMSPEQAQEQTVTYQTDLYSLGVVMFVLLTGNPPFTAPSLTDLLREIVEKPAPSIRDFRPELSEGLESIVHCALQKDLRKRYRSGGELASDLAAVFDNIDHQEHSDNEEKRFDLVRKIRFFNELSDSELWETIRVGGWEEYAPGEIIATRNDKNLSFFVIVTGDARLYREGQAVTALSPGDCFGDAGPGASSVTARSVNEVTLLRVDEGLISRTSQSCQLRLTRAFLHTLLRRLANRDSNSGSPAGGLEVA
jgi:serine/threonine protein kinase